MGRKKSWSDGKKEELERWKERRAGVMERKKSWRDGKKKELK